MVIALDKVARVEVAEVLANKIQWASYEFYPLLTWLLKEIIEAWNWSSWLLIYLKGPYFEQFCIVCPSSNVLTLFVSLSYDSNANDTQFYVIITKDRERNVKCVIEIKIWITNVLKLSAAKRSYFYLLHNWCFQMVKYKNWQYIRSNKF